MASPDVERNMDEEEEKKNSEKDELMRLIAQEMVTSLLSAGNNESEEDDDQVLAQLQAKLMEREKARKLKKRARRKNKPTTRPSQSEFLASPSPTAKSSLEDIYYSHMGGEEVPTRRPPVMPPTPTQALQPGDDIEVNLKDHDNDSFAGGHLHELVDDKHRRSSLSMSSTRLSSGSLDCKTTRSTKSGSSRDVTVRSKDLSMDEIKDYVMANIPAAVRDQIPPEAWSQIFKADAGTSTPKSTSLTSNLSSERAKNEAAAPLDQVIIKDDMDDMDDITVFSDVSGLTGAFPDGKNVERNREVLNALSHVHESSQKEQYDENFRNNNQAPEAPGENSFTHHNSARTTEKQRYKSAKFRDDAPLDGPRRVTWDQVEFRYYERIVTDNPSVQSGPAVGIGWRYKRGGRMDVDHWEQSRGPQRLSAELVMPRHVRERVLREAGISQREMAEMVRVALKVKNQRKQTVNNLPAAGVEEAVEKARRRFSRLLTLGRKKDQL